MKRIIHVDNSEFFRKIMATFLSAEGFEVESFDNAQEANFSIGAGSGDMVITGLTFSDIEGQEFLSKAVSSFSGPVIVVSASVDDNNKDKLLSLGARAAINKTGNDWKDLLKPHLSALKKT